MKQLLNADGVQVGVASAFFETALGWVGDGMVYPTSVVGNGCTVADYTPPAPVPVKQVPQQVDTAQARLALLSRGLLDRVGAEIEAMEEPFRSAAKIEWEFRITIRRDNHLVLALGALLGLSADDLDDLFIEAAKL